MNICELLENTNQIQLDQENEHKELDKENTQTQNDLNTGLSISTQINNNQQTTTNISEQQQQLQQQNENNINDSNMDNINLTNTITDDTNTFTSFNNQSNENNNFNFSNSNESTQQQQPDASNSTNTASNNENDSNQNSNSYNNSNNDETNDEEIDYNKMMLYFSVDDQNNDYSNNVNSTSVEEELAFDALGPFEKLCKLCENPTPSNIESASKYVVPALEFCATQEDYERVFAYLKKYCFYSDVQLRSYWLEQIQNVIQYIQQESDNIPIQFKDDFNMPNKLALLISELTREQSYQVKKCATTSLLYLIERQLLDNNQIEQIVIPCLLDLVKENNEDFHIDCVSLFGKLARLIGHDLTSKYFLEPFCRLCSSPVFHTRKACASNIVDIANVISIPDVETYLLPHFCEFMKDQVWAIRKVCADLFSTFALKCSRKTREEVLTECFIRLLDDSSRWVKISAYKSLGSFIATFSKQHEDPFDQNVSMNESKDSIEPKPIENSNNSSNVNPKESEIKTENIQNDKDSNNSDKNNNESFSFIILPVKDQSESISSTTEPQIMSAGVSSLEMSTEIKTLENKEIENNSSETTANSESSIAQTNKENINTSNTNDGDYSNFIYWRNSLPSLDESLARESDSKTEVVQQRIETTTTSSSGETNNSHQQEDLFNKPMTLESIINCKLTQSFGSLNNQGLYSSTNSLNFFPPQHHQMALNSKSLEQLSTELKQDIVPPVLLCYFITMVEMNSQNSLDSEMNYNCAYNFPAIALTLGVQYWKYIKDLYKKLAEDVSWKVRQTLAYSIHELAIILGTEYTQTDLVPIFDSYIKDVDEVRIGIVSNLTKFLRVLSIEYRRTYMPKLNDFLKMDNQRNWRFRNELGLQIVDFCELFPSEYLAEYVQPVAFILALDKIAEVRLTAIKSLVEILRQFERENKENYRRNFIDDVIRTFADSNKWSFRQLYVSLCEQILKTNAYNSIEAYAKDFLPKLLAFRNEKVPNIRLLLARFISIDILSIEYFLNDSNPVSNELQMTIKYLSNDEDSDVKSYFVWAQPSSKIQDENKETQKNNLSIQDMNNQNFIYNCNELEKIDSNNQLMTNNTHSEAIGIYNQNESQENKNIYEKNIIYDDDNQGEQHMEEDDDDDDDEDEIIDKTKINQLKIVNLENDLDDEMDEVIESNIPAEVTANEQPKVNGIEICDEKMLTTTSNQINENANDSNLIN